MATVLSPRPPLSPKGLVRVTAKDHALNRAFLFIKPHAVTEDMKKFVRAKLQSFDVDIAQEGSISAEDIDKKMLIDKHYYAIASKATLVKPDKLPVPEAKFKEFFQKEWKEVLTGGQALNALDALEVLKVDVPTLDKMWSQCKKDNTLLKLGGGFYCAKMSKEGMGDYYVFNAFFMAMRSKFVAPGASIYWFMVEWNPLDLCWADFRGKVLGPTDPSQAPAESIRGGCYAKWKEMGLSSEPNTADNAVHASASPLEALFERTNWLSIPTKDDPYGCTLQEHDVSLEIIEAWRRDPQVMYGHGDKKKKGSIWDALEDTDVDRCTTMLADIAIHGHTDGAVPNNQAFVFIKPHAVTPKVKDLVRKVFEDNNMTILNEGTILASQIDEEMLVDNHYYAIASKATLQKPADLPVPADKFEAKFGVKWADALASGNCVNALDACSKLGLDAAGLGKTWNEAKSAGKLIKFGGGFYCAQLAGAGGTPVYVFNGFFMEMRNKFVKPGAKIYYFVIDWDPIFLPWVDFRAKVLGATDPTKAPETSARGMILKDWQNLGLSACPNMGDNGVHGSASPVEALFERMNWLGTKLEKDPFGKLLVKGGVTPEQVATWSKDPQICYGIGLNTGSLYDDMEDVDTDVALEECIEIARTGHTPNIIHNTALVFIKPHAVTDKVKELARKHLEDSSITILKEGFIDAATIDKDQLIDKHYYAIASKATLLTPDKLPVPADKFQKQFNEDWQTVLKSGKAVNAKQAMEKWGLDAAGLGKKWLAAKDAKQLVKFGGGFYCGKIDDLYVFNGFFMEMRDKFVAPGAGIYYFLAEWDPLELAWQEFRANVLGPTDPTEAPAGSLRGKIFKGWQDLGLKSQPNTGDNGMHASASPFEGLAERMNWLGTTVEEDSFAQLLIAGGAKKEDIIAWSLDPQVTFESHHKNVTKSIYDTLEDCDADRCALMAGLILGSREHVRTPRFIAKPMRGLPTPGVFKVVFLRHGESDWNVKNIFTGWTDVDLSEAGMKEAVEAGKMLKADGFKFDIVFTSVLKRAIKTAWNALMESENYAMPVIKSWRLNERHYGGLQGLNKADTAAKYGDDQVKIWRRSYDIPPLAIDTSDSRHPANDPLYKNVPKAALPGAESLKLTVDRVLPFWFDAIAPCVMAGRSVLVAAHGNSLRAICKYLENMSEETVLEFNIPTGVPLVYELDGELKFIKKYYLLSDEEVAAKVAAVANQGKAK